MHVTGGEEACEADNVLFRGMLVAGKKSGQLQAL
jgi:hypothetical protein